MYDALVGILLTTWALSVLLCLLSLLLVCQCYNLLLWHGLLGVLHQRLFLCLALVHVLPLDGRIEACSCKAPNKPTGAAKKCAV